MLNLPKSTEVNRVVPKESIYRHSSLNTKQRQTMVDQIDKIIWCNKLSPQTLNITSDEYSELEVFRVILKDGADIGADPATLLKPIDEAISYPILFALTDISGFTRYVIAYKTINQNNDNRAVVREYFSSDWMSDLVPEITGNSIEQIYASLIHQIEPSVLIDNYKISEAVELYQHQKLARRQIEQLNKQIQREPNTAKRQELAKQRADIAKNFNITL